MQLKDSIVSSIVNIFSHKMRSFLTLLGIIFGVLAVFTMFASFFVIKNLINDRMNQLGWNNSVTISTDMQQEKEDNSLYMKRTPRPLDMDDFNTLADSLNYKYIYGTVEGWNNFIWKKEKGRVQLKGTTNDFFQVQTYPIAKGRYFDKHELLTARKVCILGPNFISRYLYSARKLLGEYITIGEQRYEIVGILDEDPLNQGGVNFNNWSRRWDLQAVYIPLSTAARYLRANQQIDQIYIQALDEASYDELKTKARQILLMRHRMAHDFSFGDLASLALQITQEMNEMMQKWNITLVAIASISLIVGGIGLFSTLLISINERMTEIGIRKSIGATNKDIFLYFIFESIILSLIGAIIGIVISVFLVQAVSAALQTSFPLPLEGVLIGIGFALFIGIVSGLYPSIKASKIDPIKAIYYLE
jgi:putative ABC transport system permease protein